MLFRSFPSGEAVVIEAVRRMAAELNYVAWVRERLAEADESVRREGWIDLDDEAWDKYWDNLENGVVDPAMSPRD